VASATLDLRGATPTSTWCITATAPVAITSAEAEGVDSYRATCKLTLYRSAPLADNAYPVARSVADDAIRVTFYPPDALPLTPQVVATVPPDVYTAVLTLSDSALLPTSAIARGRINMSATAQVLRYW
jgi:hypothetical protein